MAWVIVGSAVVGGAASVVASNIQADASKRASQSAQEAADKAAGRIEEGANKAIPGYDPYVKSGREALDKYMAGLQNPELTITNSPIYKARLERLKRDTAGALSATGKGRSGVGVTSYLQPRLLDLYDQESNAYFNRLNPMLTMGYNATVGQGNANMGIGTQMAGIETNKGQAISDNYVNAGNAQTYAVSNAANNANNALGQFSYMQGYNNNKRIVPVSADYMSNLYATA